MTDLPFTFRTQYCAAMVTAWMCETLANRVFSHRHGNRRRHQFVANERVWFCAEPFHCRGTAATRRRHHGEAEYSHVCCYEPLHTSHACHVSPLRSESMYRVLAVLSCNVALLGTVVSCSFSAVIKSEVLLRFLQPSQKTFKIKRVLAKKAKQNRPIPQWIRFRTGNKIRYNKAFLYTLRCTTYAQ